MLHPCLRKCTWKTFNFYCTYYNILHFKRRYILTVFLLYFEQVNSLLMFITSSQMLKSKCRGCIHREALKLVSTLLLHHMGKMFPCGTMSHRQKLDVGNKDKQRLNEFGES